MKRRDFLGAVGGAFSIALCNDASAQQSVPTIGFLHSGSAEQNANRLAAFRKGLAEEGFEEGRNLAIEFRWANGQNDRLAAMTADLIGRKVALIATLGSTPAALAAKAVTSTVPLLFAIGVDPVSLGLAASLSRPGGNATGVTSLNAELAAKRLGVLRDLVPGATHYYTLINPDSSLTAPFMADLTMAAAKLPIQIEQVRARNFPEVEAAFAAIPDRPGTVIVLPPDSVFYVHREALARLAARRRIPAIYDVRDYVDAGGLVSYGTDFLNVMQIAGSYAGRILKGEKPSDLPVQQTTKFEMVLNLKSAKALGIEVPTRLLATADDTVD